MELLSLVIQSIGSVQFCVLFPHLTQRTDGSIWVIEASLTTSNGGDIPKQTQIISVMSLNVHIFLF